MDIKSFNKNSEKVFLDGCNRSFEKVLVDINNIIDSAAQITYPDYEDKILHEVSDIKQEITFKIWLDLISRYVKFDSEREVKDYVMNTAEEVLNETRS